MTTMETTKCPVCGGPLNQEGADMECAYYRCVACGHVATVKVKLDENAAYALGKRELTARIREGLLEWQLTQWDRLHSDLHTFINRYPASALDIDLQMGLVACITHGFNVMDAEKYRQCKILYKQTERMYKHHLKMLKIQQDAAMTDSVNAYSEQRLQYKKCRNNYLNTKLAWKIVFTIFKKLAFH